MVLVVVLDGKFYCSLAATCMGLGLVISAVIQQEFEHLQVPLPSSFVNWLPLIMSFGGNQFLWIDLGQTTKIRKVFVDHKFASIRETVPAVRVVLAELFLPFSASFKVRWEIAIINNFIRIQRSKGLEVDKTIGVKVA